MKRASYYEKRGGKIRCLLCPHFCTLTEGKKGICGVREVRNGELLALTYGKIAALAVDPVEKKPLYHFFPGRDILSIGSTGCNFHCAFCQNWHLIEGKVPLKVITIDALVSEAQRTGSVGIAYTYNEPLIQWEFVYDCAKAVHNAGMKNVLVTNGYINPEPLEELLPYIDALNIDLKFFDEEKYRKIAGGSLEVVKKSIELASRTSHLEVTTLIVTGKNDGEDEISRIVDFIARLDPGIPFHLSRYYPNYRCHAPETPHAVMTRAYEIAKKSLHYVYPGNMHIPGTSDSSCPSCGNLLIKRQGYSATIRGLTGGKCSSCDREVNFFH